MSAIIPVIYLVLLPVCLFIVDRKSRAARQKVEKAIQDDIDHQRDALAKDRSLIQPFIDAGYRAEQAWRDNQMAVAQADYAARIAAREALE